MNIDLEMIRDIASLEEELDGAKKRKEKLKQLLLSTRSRTPQEDAEAKAKELEIENEIREKTEELEKLRSKKENMSKNIILEAPATREQFARAAAMGFAKMAMCKVSKGKERHALTDLENRAFYTFNNEQNVARFMGGKDALVEELKFNKRANFEATTTSAQEFVAATADILGENNGGVFIPVETMYDLLGISTRESMFFQDVRKISVNSKLEFPYSKGNTGAQWVHETDCTADEQIEWAVLELGAHDLAKYIRVTWQLRAMTPESFLTYLLEEIRNEMDKAKNIAVLYGRGPDHMEEINGTMKRAPQPYGVAYQTSDANQKGVSSIRKVIGSTGDYADVLTAMESMPLDLLDLNEDAFDGARFYMSPRAFASLWNAKDSNGDRMFDIARPITFFGEHDVVVDKRLKGLDIIFGNPQNYVWNEVEPVRLYQGDNLKCRYAEFAAWGKFGGMGKPNSFIYATDSTTPRDSVPSDVRAFRNKLKAAQPPVVGG